MFIGRKQYFIGAQIVLLILFIILMLNQTQDPAPLGFSFTCETRRQHFNHLRNTSTKMRNCLTWDFEQPEPLIQLRDQDTSQRSQTAYPREEDNSARQRKGVSFDPRQNVETNLNKSKLNQTAITNKRTDDSQNNSFNARERSRSANPVNRKTKGGNEDTEIRNRIRQRQLEEEAEKKEENRQKIKRYIQEQRPYTRSMTNTKYQDLFDKAALESYGRGNTKNAIGGMHYGNNLKTFNMNPHIRGNEPKNYQTHQTAINYSKRTKLNNEDKWKRLEKQLCKKLGLKDKNETLKEGKEVVYVDVDESNMHQIMRENLKFKKEHDEDIRQREKEYNALIEGEKQAAIEEFYAKKQERILNGNTVESSTAGFVCDRDEKERLQEQVVYRTTDKYGNVRIGGDRHALTCFVDMNFPENSAAYTQELIDRMPIYPVEVEAKDKHIDNQRRANYEKSQDNIYPSHYLLPNSDQPEIIKMINGKYGQAESQQDRRKAMGSTFATTAIDRSPI